MGINALRSGALESLVSDLKSEAGCEIVREMKPRRAARSQALDGEATSVYVARMALETFLELRARAAATRPEACIELDGELDYNWGWAANPASLQAALVERLRVDRMRRALSAPRGSRSQQIRLRVLGENQAPVANAHVRLEAVAAPQEGLTDGNGELTLTLHVSAGSGARSLFVDPPGDYWTRYLRYPGLNPEIDNVIVLRSLDKNLRDSGNGARYGWGQRWMGIDQLPAQMTGRGAKIAIIDSGADNQHPLLKHITNGVDLTGNGNRSTWAEDLVGHGSHCSGIIAAQGSEGVALRGFAPQAELHLLKVFPGGRYSTLLDALEYCIEHQIDVVNLSLGGSDASEAIEQKLEEAVENGVAFIAAAGDSAGPVQYPASSAHVLSVAALGLLGEFPPNSWESQTIPPLPELLARDGVFMPSFSSFGPKVDVSAPGVGIISSIPGGGLGAHSGTSVAAAHVSGLAALLVAHHPWFRNLLQLRNSQRVAGLYQLVREACPPACSAAYQQDLGVQRVGAGMPLIQRLVASVQSASYGGGAANLSSLPLQPSGASLLPPFGAAQPVSQFFYRPL
jgi:subtilisin family serine protease